MLCLFRSLNTHGDLLSASVAELRYWRHDRGAATRRQWPEWVRTRIPAGAVRVSRLVRSFQGQAVPDVQADDTERRRLVKCQVDLTSARNALSYRCPTCRTAVEKDTVFCPKCGALLKAAQAAAVEPCHARRGIHQLCLVR